MSSHADAAGLSPAAPHARERGNVLRLAVAQALAGADSVVVYATGATLGNALAPSPALATRPISIFMRRRRRRPARGWRTAAACA